MFPERRGKTEVSPVFESVYCLENFNAVDEEGDPRDLKCRNRAGSLDNSRKLK